MAQRISRTVQVDPAYHGQRIDQCLHTLFPDFSRAQWQRWIDSGEVTVNGQTTKPKKRLKGYENIQADCSLHELALLPQSMPLSIIYEDDALIVLNKPAGLVVHPGAGCPDQTLVNGRLAHCDSLNTLPRAGLVHRLDKDTSGLLVIGKTSYAYHQLVDAMQQRQINRHYHAIVQGNLDKPQTLTTQMGRHPIHRTKMAVLKRGGKTATTHISPIKQFANFSWLRLTLETGRTHQIRVHLAHLGYPVVGDTTYGNHRQQLTLNRQALHAYALSLGHPTTGQTMTFYTPMPGDMRQFLAG